MIKHKIIDPINKKKVLIYSRWEGAGCYVCEMTMRKRDIINIIINS